MLAKHSSYSRQEGEKKERKKEEKKELVPSDHKNDTAHKQQLRYARKKRNWLSTRARVHTHTHTHTCIKGGERVKESPSLPLAKSTLNIKQDCMVIAPHRHAHTHARAHTHTHRGTHVHSHTHTYTH